MALKVSLKQHFSALLELTRADPLRQGRYRARQGAHEHWRLFHRPAHGAGRPVGVAGGYVPHLCNHLIPITVYHVADTSCSVYRVHPISRGPRILVAVGPGNNGELVAASCLGVQGSSHCAD